MSIKLIDLNTKFEVASLPLQADLVTTGVSISNTFGPLCCNSLCHLRGSTNVELDGIFEKLQNENKIQPTVGSDPTQRQAIKTKTHRDGADATRLSADHPTHGAQPAVDMVVQDELSDLGGFPTPCFPADHNHAV